MSKRKRIVVITGDHFRADPDKLTGAYEKEDLEEHQKMVSAFKGLDDIELVDVFNDHADLLNKIQNASCDLFVNFCDTGLMNIVSQEIHVPVMIEISGKKYTGCNPASIIRCYDKSAVSLVAKQMGIPVADEIYVRFGENLPKNIKFPALLKPNMADGSLGITKDAVVKNESEAGAYLKWLYERLPGKDVLIQEYLPGPEYGVGLLGNGNDIQVLTPLEVDFDQLPKNLAPILSYESKADPSSPYWSDIKFKKAEITEGDRQTIENHCRVLFQRLGMRDYGRFDFRKDRSGVIKLMEVNPNPAWASDGKLAHMARLSGLTYGQMLEKIVNAAFNREVIRA